MMITTIILRATEWTPKACDKFADLTHVAQWKPLIAKIKYYEYPMLSESDDQSHYFSSPVFYIELYEKNDDKVRKENKSIFFQNLLNSFKFFQADSFAFF